MKYVGDEIHTIILHPNPKRVIKRDGTRLSQSQAENSWNMMKKAFNLVFEISFNIWKNRHKIGTLWLDSKLADENTQRCVQTQNCCNPHCSIQE